MIIIREQIKPGYIKWNKILELKKSSNGESTTTWNGNKLAEEINLEKNKNL